jgi:TonB family protein
MMSDKMMFGEAFDPKDNFFSRLLSNFKAAWAASTGEGDVPGDAPVHFTMIREEIVFKRLADQLGFAFGELQRDPAGFVKVLVSPDESNPDQLKTRQAAWALTVIVPLGVIGAFLFGILIYFLIYGRPLTDVQASDDVPLYDVTMLDKPYDKPKPADKDGKAGKPGDAGGGGGGKNEPQPVAKGVPPQTSMKLDQPIADLTTKTLPPPPPKPLNLPNSVIAESVPDRTDDLARLGDPNGKVGPESDGSGKGGNYGSGAGSGVGGGDGRGEGAGQGFGRGGGPGGNGGGGDGGGANSRVVATKARVLNSPRPAYTEQARQNKTQGNVVVRVTLGANGRVKSASVVKGLPDGLNEKAIEAAYRLSFEPARNGAGVPIDSTLTVSVNFTIR